MPKVFVCQFPSCELTEFLHRQAVTATQLQTGPLTLIADRIRVKSAMNTTSTASSAKESIRPERECTSGRLWLPARGQLP